MELFWRDNKGGRGCPTRSPSLPPALSNQISLCKLQSANVQWFGVYANKTSVALSCSNLQIKRRVAPPRHQHCLSPARSCKTEAAAHLILAHQSAGFKQISSASFPFAARTVTSCKHIPPFQFSAAAAVCLQQKLREKTGKELSAGRGTFGGISTTAGTATTPSTFGIRVLGG